MTHRYIALATACLVQSATADTLETVFFLADDLSSATIYFSSRQDGMGDQSYYFLRPFDQNLVLYARPENYRWRSANLNNKEYHELEFPDTASYAFLRREPERKKFLTQLGPTTYRLEVNGSRCVPEGCVNDEVIVSVVLPKRFRISKHEGRPRGNWKVVDNTYTFYAQRVRGANVELEFEDCYASLFNSVNNSMVQLKGVEVRNVDGTIKIIMPMDNVFATGGVTMRPEGAAWVKSLAASLKDAAAREIRIEGHADNAPIKSAVFPSNWELSSARAAQALRVFLTEGLPPPRLIASGFADSRPIAEGNSPEARARNRRIEFTVVPDLPLSCRLANGQ